LKDFTKKTSAFLNVTIRDHLDNLSLLILRLVLGLTMLLQHGWVKMQNYENIRLTFPDPLNLGNPQLSLIMALGAEVVCALLVAVGFLTRLAAIPLVVTMLVAFFLIHGDDPFAKKELAFLYLTGFVVLALRGAGKLSVDGMLTK